MIFLKAIFIGLFAIFPGISGSALAISLNLYDKIIISLKNIRENMFFLLIVSLGIIIGIIIGSNLIIYLTNITDVLYYIFAGLIISEIPSMINKTKKKGNLKCFFLLFSFVFSTVTFILGKKTITENPTFISMFIGGFLFSFGKIFPGVSSSFFLILLGIYKEIIICFSNPLVLLYNFGYYFPFIIGVIIGFLIFIRLLYYLLTNKYDTLHSILIGFMISSVISIIPKFKYNLVNYIGIILIVISFIISFIIKRKKEI